MRYVDYSIKIEPSEGEKGYRVLLMDSPAGQDRSYFDPAAADPAFEEPLAALRNIWCADRARADRTGDCAAPADTAWWPVANKIGDNLFRALFTPTMKNHLRSSQGLARERRQGLRLRLHFDPRHPQLTHLLRLPWEFLFDAAGNQFLNLDLRYPVVRYLDIPQPVQVATLRSPLFILLASAQPKDLDSLSLTYEAETIKRVLKDLDGVEVHSIDHVSWSTLRRELRNRRYHVLHFMGHGGIDETCGQEGVFFENDSGYSRFISAQQFTACLSGLESLRFIFLNTCQYTLKNRFEDPNPFSNTAASLLMAGIPAVLAMQFPIGDAAAIFLAKTFYERLVKGEPIETALTEGRLGLYSNNTTRLDWAAPVLYLRSSHGHLFPDPAKAPGLSPGILSEPKFRRFRGLFFLAFLLVGLIVAAAVFKEPGAIYRLRSRGQNNLSVDDLRNALVMEGLFDTTHNPTGAGLPNRFHEKGEIVFDAATGLSWEKSGSELLSIEQSFDYIRQLNRQRFGGHADWRLPTVEEGMSLMENEVQGSANFIDTVFNTRQYRILTCDTNGKGFSWHVFFREGGCAAGESLTNGYVRAVRTVR